MEKVKLGIIGMGRMGITHYAIVNSRPDVEIVSISDTSKVTLDVLKKFNPQLETYSDFNKQLKLSKIDGVIICTPPAMHHKVCMQALEKKIHVFCEKPFTTDPANAQELAEKFEQAGLVNQVGYVNRFNDVFMTAKKYIASGLLGKIVRFRSEMFSATITKPDSGSGWRNKRENGGGVTYEMAAHALDLVNYMLGAPAKVVGSSMNQIYSKNVEDVVSTTLLYDNGLSGTMYVNWSDTSYRKPSNKLEFFGTNGKLLADQHGMKLYLNEEMPEQSFRKGWNTIYITDIFTPVPFYVRGNEFTRQLYAFVDSIKAGDAKTQCSFRDGWTTQRIIHNIFADYATNGR